MICTRVFFCNIILEATKKRVCTIEHTFTFSLEIRCYAQYQLWITGCWEMATRYYVRSFCRAARENRTWSDQFQLIEIC
jgi:hypothetical protein